MKHIARSLIIFAVVGQLAACLPNPESVEQRRNNFDRTKAKPFILDKAPERIQTPHNAIFDGRIQFLGFDVDKESVQPGEDITITSYFKVLKPVNRNYKMFLHLDGSARVHGDHWPVDEKYPTDVWLPGEVIKDVYTVRVYPHINSRTLGVYLGFFIGEERMPITNTEETRHDNQNRARAGAINLNLGR